MKMVQAAFDR